MNKKEQFIKNALAQKGYAESGSNQTKYATDLESAGFMSGLQGQPWCCMFCMWVAFVTCGRNVTTTASFVRQKTISCTTWLKTFKTANAFKAASSTIPNIGDVIFFGSGDNSSHVGLVVSASAAEVNTIEGNSGDKVAERTYNIATNANITANDIIGYGTLNWSVIGVATNETFTGSNTEAGDGEGLGGEAVDSGSLPALPPTILSARILSPTTEGFSIALSYFTTGTTSTALSFKLKIGSAAKKSIQPTTQATIKNPDGSENYTADFVLNNSSKLPPNTECKLDFTVEGATTTDSESLTTTGTLTFALPESYPTPALNVEIIPLGSLHPSAPFKLIFQAPEDWGYWSGQDNQYKIILMTNSAKAGNPIILRANGTNNEAFAYFTPSDFDIVYGSNIQASVQPFTEYKKDGVLHQAICPIKAISNTICLRDKTYISNRAYLKVSNTFWRVALTE